MSAGKTKALGRGLDALFRDTSVPVPVKSEVVSAEADEKGENHGAGLRYVDINDIKPNAKQPRKSFSDEAIDELARSIKEDGLIEPIVLRICEGTDQGYELVVGERRWRAARKAGLREIPSLIRDISDTQSALLALIENTIREDLNPVEEAEAIHDIMESYGMTQEEVGEKLQRSRPYVANILRLLKLPQEVRDFLASGKLSAGHGKAIASLKSPVQQLELARHIVDKGCSVREAESLAANGKFGAGKRGRPARVSKGHEVIAVEEELKSILGTKVTLKHKDGKGSIEVHYYSSDELEGIIEMLRSLQAS